MTHRFAPHHTAPHRTTPFGGRCVFEAFETSPLRPSVVSPTKQPGKVPPPPPHPLCPFGAYYRNERAILFLQRGKASPQCTLMHLLCSVALGTLSTSMTLCKRDDTGMESVDDSCTSSIGDAQLQASVFSNPNGGPRSFVTGHEGVERMSVSGTALHACIKRQN